MTADVKIHINSGLHDLDMLEWKGQNLLGEILMQVREELKNGKNTMASTE